MADHSARFSYYGVNGTPNARIDGVDRGAGYSSWGGHISNANAAGAPLSISLSGSFDYLSNTGQCNILVSPDAPISGSYKLYLVLVEDGLYHSGLYHGSVMRDMYPSSSGQSIDLSSGTNVTQDLEFAVPSPYVLENTRLVAFVQNTATKAILNAAVVEVGAIGPVNIPNLSVLDKDMQVINDDGDDKLNPGEEAHLAITLENACGWVDAEDVQATLYCSDPYVTIHDNSAAYDLIVSCDFIENSLDLFHISVSEDAPMIHDIEFEMRVSANLDSEAPYNTSLMLTYSMDMFQLNFPVQSAQTLEGGNAVVDLDGDGAHEILIGSNDSLLHAYTLEGTELSGFPFQATNKIQGAPAVADLDNDGDLEVVCVDRDGNIYVVQHDGSGAIIATAASYLLGTPALTDFDADGDLEIVAGGWGYDLLAVHHDGTSMAGFPKLLSGEKMSSGVALADINADGIDEILVGTWGDNLHVFDSMGNELAGFPVDVEDDIKASPIVADLDGDNQLEILVAQDEGELWAISPTGEVLWTNASATAGVRVPPAVADFNGDGNREVIIAAVNGYISIIDHLGMDMPNWPSYLGSACNSAPVIADIDSDGALEFYLGSDGDVIHGFQFDGTPVLDFPLNTDGPVKSTPTVMDLDQDGNLEIIAGSNNDLLVFDIKSSGTTSEMWYTDRGNNRRTGAYLYGYVVSTEPAVALPEHLRLAQNYPNPFNPTTKLEFDVPASEMVHLTIYDISGKEITQLVNRHLDAGSYSVVWDGRDAAARTVETGVYFARISSGGSEQVVKMMLLK